MDLCAPFTQIHILYAIEQNANVMHQIIVNAVGKCDDGSSAHMQQQPHWPRWKNWSHNGSQRWGFFLWLFPKHFYSYSLCGRMAVNGSGLRRWFGWVLEFLGYVHLFPTVPWSCFYDREMLDVSAPKIHNIFFLSVSHCICVLHWNRYLPAPVFLPYHRNAYTHAKQKLHTFFCWLKMLYYLTYQAYNCWVAGLAHITRLGTIAMTTSGRRRRRKLMVAGRGCLLLHGETRIVRHAFGGAASSWFGSVRTGWHLYSSNRALNSELKVERER